MSVTPLQKARAWFGEKDEMGGFRAAGKALFPGWEPKRSCRAPHREDKTASFSMYRNERQEWRFKDFATGQHGGLVGFVMLAGMDEKQASRWLMEKAGVKAEGTAFDFIRRGGRKCAGSELAVAHRGSFEAEIAMVPAKPPAISREAEEAWREGVDHLRTSGERVEALAEFRSWPVEWAQCLADAGAISMPLYHGQRTIAFLVEAPEGESGGATGLKMWQVGFHCRLKPARDEKRASWRFVPNAKEHGQSTPALPFVLGGASFAAARLLVITGGQWDALTFAFAAGWMGEGSCWPEGVCVIGIRGDASSNVFLRSYAPFWPPSANCLLLPDADASGGQWCAGEDSFARRLSVRCRKVAVVQCGAHKDFNDLHRVAPIAPRQIVELLASHGMALETEAAK